MRTVSIVGAGRLGCALALALDAAGYRVRDLIYRSKPPADSVVPALSRPVFAGTLDKADISSELILITTQDTEISAAAQALAPKMTSGIVLHTSGSLSSEELQPLRSSGVSVGSFHPLVSISEPHAGAARFAGAYFCVEGDADAVAAAVELAADLQGHSFSIDPAKKPLYHAAAVMASGHLVALLDTAADALRKSGMSGIEGVDVLLPLISSTLENLRRQRAEDALTGTFARLDRPAFERHLNSLEEAATENEIDIYLDLAIRSLEIVRRRAGDSVRLQELAQQVSIAKSSRRVKIDL